MHKSPETLTICKNHDLPTIMNGECECKDVAYYIRKDIAQEEFTELHSALKRKEEVLQPIRDVMDAVEVNGISLNICEILIDACVETLRRADKQ